MGFLGIPFVSKEFLYYLKSYGIVLLLGMAGATPLPQMVTKKLKESLRGEKAVNILEPVALIGLLLLNTAYLVDSSFNPFLYFRF